MNLVEQHSHDIRHLVEQIKPDSIAKWLLEEGYYPEQYVIPPTFKVTKFDLQNKPFAEIDNSNLQTKFEPDKTELVSVSFPKTQFSDRSFGVINPKIYHDIVWYLVDEWNLIVKKLFRNDNKIHSYSFPIPVTKENVGFIGDLRSGRMIYEFLEMAENDLVSEAYNYKIILRTDIKNFYPSIYTHSIAWALHGKEIIRRKGNRSKFDEYVGLVLDKLFQYANDGCTNGIPIGPAVSDLIAEIILSEIDTCSSQYITKESIEFIGVRFKDDYRFLCHNKQDAHIIIKILQKQLSKFNLNLNENKFEVDELPEGLFREWTSHYQQYSLKYFKKINYKKFENSFRGTLLVDKKYPGTGVVDRFLSELYNKKFKLKFNFDEKELLKTISLLLMLKERRSKSFPQILGILQEILIEKSLKNITYRKIVDIIEKIVITKLKKSDDNQYDLLWLIYLVKCQELFKINFPKKIACELINCLKANRTEIFKPLLSGVKIYDTIKKPGSNIPLLEYLALFKKDLSEASH